MIVAGIEIAIVGNGRNRSLLNTEVFFMSFSQIIILIPVLLFSVIAHEVAHGYVAYRCGDNTAKFQGRITLNPIPHIDILGTIIFPVLLLIMQAPILFGWAKPVPVNPYNFKDQKYGNLKVAFSGPGANLLVASFFGIVGRILPLGAEARFFIFNQFGQISFFEF